VITESSPIIDNTESVNWYFKTADGKKWVKDTPWHGNFALFTVGNPSTGIDMVQTRLSELMIVYVDTNDISFHYSPTVDPNWKTTTKITTGANWSEPSICVAWNGQIEVRATQLVAGVPKVFRMYSLDYGSTWEPIVSGTFTPELVLSAATQSKLRSDTDGNILELVFVPDSGTTGPGTFSARYQGAGSSTFSSPYVPKDNTGANLRSDGSGFGHDKATEGPNRWWLVMVKDGESTQSVWNSGDLGKTWKKA
jgi:hypothetical protein